MAAKKIPTKALGIWKSGVDEGYHTIGLPLAWIRNFDVSTYDPNDKDMLMYKAEWRNGRNKPPGGWPLEKVQIVAISHTKKDLVAKCVELKLESSPSKQLENDSDDESKKRKPNSAEATDTPKKKQKKPPTPKKGATSKISPKKPSPKKSGKPPVKPSTSTNRSPNQPDKAFDQRLQKMEDVLAQISSDTLLIKKMLKTSDVDKKQEPIKQEKPIVEKKGSKYVHVGRFLIPKYKYNVAIEKKTFTSFGIQLMLSMFDRETLLLSNVGGGASKVKAEEAKADKKQKLDPDKMEAIREEVQSAYPYSFNRSGLFTALNVKLNSLRNQNKGKKKENDDIKPENNGRTKDKTDDIGSENGGNSNVFCEDVVVMSGDDDDTSKDQKSDNDVDEENEEKEHAKGNPSGSDRESD